MFRPIFRTTHTHPVMMMVRSTFIHTSIRGFPIHTHPVMTIFLGVKAAPSTALPDAGHKSAADSAAATEVPERWDMH